ncbi:mannose-1-phosphate guanylyltransferase [Heyndrickxia coagulans P38]|uniref:sugar phosphate nucleotidyltransferase n=1 Tax=Heyndrickxia coagulans TaxID=1398 RepID=UPI0005567BB4|nr:sugar phosphate nucleotidyltransferase [Heyndrickxia coagulans]KGT37732.1 mannose-1-phosphate guanylyltransferase [Heyndrickxia coagulans P38]MBF8417259.1 cupin domain-containing protein [Heyndrickxia coagulans]
MKLVLLSGGSGKRLWPLSNDARSKQFLKVLHDQNGNLQSMVQRVWNQLKIVGLDKSTVIATSQSQMEMIQDQLNEEADLIIEPNRKDTFPAIALAASYLYTNKNTDLDEVIAVLPVDPYVDDRFFNRVKDLEKAINVTKSDLALIGVKPTYPSEKYGYIVPKKKVDGSFETIEVECFIEKPTEEKAKELINQGALWNCGVFGFRLGYLIQLLKEKQYPVQYEGLLEIYDKLPKISFDYEVVEKTKKIAALPYDGYWKDLGTWNTLTEEMVTNQIGYGIISEDSTNTHLINELSIPVTVLGVSNAVIAVSPDGILVSDKEKSPQIKKLVGNFDDRPMYEERRWGWYRVLDYAKYDENQQVLTKRIGIRPGENLSYQYHLTRKETWTVLKGEGIVALNGKLRTVREGDVLQIQIGDKHAIKAITEMEIIEVQAGSELSEEDIVRICMDWMEVEDLCYSII